MNFRRFALLLLAAATLGHSSPERYLRSGESTQNILAAPTRAAGMPYNYKYVRQSSTPDTIKVIAIRVEFQLDSDVNTTGNGRFGIWMKDVDTVHSHEDTKELRWYEDGSYVYDLLPHDSLYVSQKLDHLVEYYDTVSRGQLTIEYEIFPKGQTQQDAYQLPLKMALYSPGSKIPTETYNDFYYRSFKALVSFYRDAILYSNQGITAKDTVESPFENLVLDDKGTLWEVNDLGEPVRKAVILVIHAGSSNLTDAYQNSSSDLTDNFMTEQFIEVFYRQDQDVFQGQIDTINGRTGFKFKGYNDSTFIISEMMMISETSNQDSVNYGTHGILVNQFARQIGIPDLYSTTSSSTGVGRFGIMDFQGYSAANGFIPPYPSAWTRLYMGWDAVKVINPGEGYDVPALGTGSDTTMALIPINENEYWLVENRQRNLTGDSSMFNYDTAHNQIYIDADSAVNYDKVVDSVTSISKVIMSTKSRDIGIPASGLAVWHVDEALIDNRIEYNFVNTDSAYRGVSLEEADGVQDLGTSVSNGFSTWYDYGGPEDIFPHKNRYYDQNGNPRKAKNNTDSIDIRNILSPVTVPSSKANDGGNTYLRLHFNVPELGNVEVNRLRRAADEDNKHYDYFVENYVGSSLRVTVSRDDSLSIKRSENWPVNLHSVPHFDPLSYDIAGIGTPQIILLDSLGHLTVYDEDANLLPDSTSYTISVDSAGSNDTIYYTDSIPGCYTFPTLVNDRMAIPSRTGDIYFYSSIAAGTGIDRSIFPTNKVLTSPIVGSAAGSWYVGTQNGEIIQSGDFSSISTVLKSGDTSAISALSLSGNTLFSVSNSGTVTAFSGVDKASLSLSSLVNAPLFPPYTMVSGDLNGDDILEVAVVDSKQGLFLLQWDPSTLSLKQHPQSAFQQFPNDWAGYYHIDTGRSQIRPNGGQPALSDITGDGNIEIIIPGSNGIFAFNHQGIMIPEWPVILDKINWNTRYSVYASPITVKDSSDEIFTLFSTPTGENLTYELSKVDSTGRDSQNNGKFVIYFTTSTGFTDSITDCDSLYVYDTILVQEDSTIIPYVMPGGLIDAVDAEAKRPDTTIFTNTVKNRTFSPWPLTVGGAVKTSPLFVESSTGDNAIYGINQYGTLYRWDIDRKKLSSGIWSTTGGTPYRQFSLSGSGETGSGSPTVESFYSYPNPVRITGTGPHNATFRYELNSDAQKALLTIYTVDGRRVVSQELGTGRGINEYTMSDLSRFGSAVYTCRLEVTFESESVVKFWKMVVLRGRK